MSYHFAFDWPRNHASSHSLVFSMHAFIRSIQEIWPVKKHKNYHQVSLSDYLKFYLPNLQQRICAHFEATTPFTAPKPQLYSCSFRFTGQHCPDSGCCSIRKVLVLKGNDGGAGIQKMKSMQKDQPSWYFIHTHTRQDC